MPVIEIGGDDVARSRIVTEAGWQTAVVKEVGERPANTDGSTLFVIDVVIEGGDFDGVMVRFNFSEKAPGFAIRFFEAFGNKVGKDGGKFDFDATVGQRLQIFIEMETYQGRPVNRVQDYRPAV